MNKYRLSEETRPFIVTENGTRKRVMLRQIIAERHFADVTPGQAGGWVEDSSQLSQSGRAWIYHHNTLVWGGARITDNAQISGECLISGGAWVGDNAVIHSCELYGPVKINGRAQVMDSQVRGRAHICEAVTVNLSQITGMEGEGSTGTLRIEGRASVFACKVAHQAFIGEAARLRYALVDHRAAIYGRAELIGNDINHVWVCDCAQVFDAARLIAGDEEGQSPVLRYGARVFGSAEIYGDCLLRQRVQVCDNARLRGGPLILDGEIEVSGHASLIGNLLVEDRVTISGPVTIRTPEGEALHLRGPKSLNRDELITQIPFYGLY